MKSPAFQFYPKQWLGDDNVMLMGWAARGMHMHFMCIAWQQSPACTLPNDDAILRSWAANSPDWDLIKDRWEEIKQQVLRAWTLDENDRYTQAGLLAEYRKQTANREVKRKAADIRWHERRDNKPHHKTSDARALHVQCSSSSSSISTSVENTPPTPPPGVAVPVELSPLRQQFEQDWLKFWSKASKESAFKAYKKAIKLAPRDKIMAAVDSHGPLILARAKSQGITPIYPATWLNAGRWDDDPSIYELPARLPVRAAPIDRKQETLRIFRERMLEDYAEQNGRKIQRA